MYFLFITLPSNNNADGVDGWLLRGVPLLLSVLHSEAGHSPLLIEVEKT